MASHTSSVLSARHRRQPGMKSRLAWLSFGAMAVTVRIPTTLRPMSGGNKLVEGQAARYHQPHIGRRIFIQVIPGIQVIIILKKADQHTLL